jgi:hypothetical protein
VTLFDGLGDQRFFGPQVYDENVFKKLGCSPKEYRRQINSFKNPLTAPDSPHPLQFYYSEAEALELIDKYMEGSEQPARCHPTARHGRSLTGESPEPAR